jgi:hypothetical protein
MERHRTQDHSYITRAERKRTRLQGAKDAGNQHRWAPLLVNRKVVAPSQACLQGQETDRLDGETDQHDLPNG